MHGERICGIETEYGVIEVGQPYANAIELSSAIVEAVSELDDVTGGHGVIPWDFHGESPLQDARGFSIDRGMAHPSQLTDNPDELAPSGDESVLLQQLSASDVEALKRPRALNTVIANGARVYVDHAHPEYSSPEFSSAYQAVLYDRAGDALMKRAMEFLHRQGRDIVIYKNNVDGKGASYGAHENFLVSRKVDFSTIIKYMTPFFATRFIMCGTGRVGRGQKSEGIGFQISQRADYIENDVGLETTFDRPIINTRDEPHADESLYRRLHVITGDANQFDMSIFLKIGVTSLLLGFLEKSTSLQELDACFIDDPVEAVHVFSRDPSLQVRVVMTNGRQMSALEIQKHYYRVLCDFYSHHRQMDEDVQHILSWWKKILDMLSGDIFDAAPYVEWVAKYQLLLSMKERDGLSWDSDRLKAFDVQWHDLRSSHSIVEKLDAKGKVYRFFPYEEVEKALMNPPETTRAFLRGVLIRRYGQYVKSVGWNSLVVELPEKEKYLRIPLMYPDRATRALIGKIMEDSTSITDFIRRLIGNTTTENESE